MGKKRRRTKKSSKGAHSSVSKSTIQLCYADAGDKLINKQIAWKKGKNPWVTVFNSGGPTDRQYIRLRANDAWGDPRRKYNIYTSHKKETKEEVAA